MHSAHQSAQLIFQALKKIGVSDVVISPGSRNSPLVMESLCYPEIKKHVLVDERSAAFFGLGITQRNNKPVALVCTSGSAVLNYSPAVVEAYYQKRPLLVISADRPSHLIDIGDNQTIRQAGALGNYTKKNLHLPEGNPSKQAVEDLFSLFCTSVHPPYGPIHLNVAFDEPLYEKSELKSYTFPEVAAPAAQQQSMLELEKSILKSKKPMILLGQLNPDEKLLAYLTELEKKGWVVLSESISNVFTTNTLACIDRFIHSFTEEEKEVFAPDLLLTIGTNVVSKKVKKWLREVLLDNHFHLGASPYEPNTFFQLKEWYRSQPSQLLAQLNFPPYEDNTFSNLWKEREARVKVIHHGLMKQLDFSDLWVYHQLVQLIPSNSVLQMGNSAVVRYQQLFDEIKNVKTFSNRGTSGIDGSLSTAVGYATANPKDLVFCLIGDISFFYDSNGLFQQQLPNNLKVVIINNHGGNIFRIIPGPSKVQDFETFIETQHSFSAKGICETFNVSYFEAKNKEEVLKQFEETMKMNKCTVMEIHTPAKKSSQTLKWYFSELRTKICA